MRNLVTTKDFALFCFCVPLWKGSIIHNGVHGLWKSGLLRHVLPAERQGCLISTSARLGFKRATFHVNKAKNGTKVHWRVL